ncbi:pilus assembly protein [Luteibacter aegosomaticola]|uniref:pilus assembly PilX family protein n=1 Tax=Luteibacter aegosomaticola TaxID=2911538 RepID=UPI001FF9B662|nr:PilX N-terminal domain-containing pilus assembly protein [Luteibacter aegosomaticola]UPG92221.1 pilus assembly protein [Luteibacter aegosomaticola]
MKRERGAVLIIALIFLLLLTIVAITSSSRSLIQERLAGALRNAQQAEWSAENALRGVEWRIFTGDASLGCYNSSNPGTVSSKVTTFRNASTWVTAGATEYKGSAVSLDYSATTTDTTMTSATLAANPWYIVEYLGQDRAPPSTTGAQAEAGSGGSTTARFYLYRITARAVGGSPNTIRVVESTFVTPNLFTCTLS